MSDIIQLLPDNVANQIAAGEVIQRPASAVKELLENAIDAKATEIKLIIKEAGKTLIQVIDNGIGMSVTDARLAFERHATSKIRVAEDLFTLHSKGFRGEALASVAAISQVELITKQADDSVGTKVNIQANKVTSQEPTIAQKGTSISMKNLFFNIPARRSFLKSDNVELRHILDEFHRVALAHPEIHFYLVNNSEELFNLPAANFRQRISHIFGKKMNERLLPVQEQTEILNISGFVCRPSSKRGKNIQFFFVNNRFIKNRYLHHAVVSAFEGLVKEGEQPEYFLYLEIDPKRIDINIHPTKTEIKFEDDHTIYALLKSAIRHSLGQFNVTPTIDFSLDTSMQIPYHYKDKEAKMPTYLVDTSYNPFEQQPKRNEKLAVNFPKKTPQNWESLYTGVPSKINDYQGHIVSEPVSVPLFQEDFEQGKPTILHFQKKYLLTYLKEKIRIIYINRAHQRILYEQFLKSISEDNLLSQQLLFPVEIELSVIDNQLFMQNKNRLSSMGFVFEIQNDKVIFTAFPVGMTEQQARDFIDEIVFKEIEDFPSEKISQRDFLAKTLAKTMAISTGKNLSQEEQEQMIKNLFSCQEPMLSPFGKKTYVEISVTDIDNKFI